MKDHKSRIALLLIIATVAGTSTVGCGSNEDKPTDQPNKNSQAMTDVGTSTGETEHSDISTYLAQIEYYEELIATLENKLLAAKEESFISNTTFEQQIKELQDSISELSERLDNVSVGVIPEDQSNNNIYNEEKVPPTEQLSVGSQFKHTDINGKLTITGYTGNATQLTIPDKIGGKAVSVIGEDAFKGGSYERITLPEGLTEIGWFAFSGCTKLCEITIPASVTSIGYGAFDLCPENIIIKCQKGSYAEAYAKSWGFLTVSQ